MLTKGVHITFTEGRKTQSQIEFSHGMYPQNNKAIFPFLGAFVKLFILTSVFAESVLVSKLFGMCSIPCIAIS